MRSAMDASTAAVIWNAKVSTMTVMFGFDVGIGTPGRCFWPIVRGLDEMGNQIAVAGNSHKAIATSSINGLLVRFCRCSEVHHEPVQEFRIEFFNRVAERIA